MTFGSGLTSIGAHAFRECKSLESAVLPDSVTEIGENAFNGCEALADIKLSKELNLLAREVFYNCKSLTAVKLPEKLKILGEGCFRNCARLASVTILSENCSFAGDPYLFSNSYLQFDTVLFGYAGSTTETFASKYGYQFKPLKGDAAETAVTTTETTTTTVETTTETTVTTTSTAAPTTTSVSTTTVLKTGAPVTTVSATTAVSSASTTTTTTTVAATSTTTTTTVSTTTSAPATTVTTVTTESEGLKKHCRGDVDGDCVVTVGDAQQALRAYVRILAGGENMLNEAETAAADVDLDGKITAADPQNILLYYAVNSLAHFKMSWEELFALHQKSNT